MNRIRISCGALCRIEIAGSYLVEINKNRGDILTPIGGALEFHETARPLLEAMDAIFEKRNDLRLTIPADNIPDFDAWFTSRQDRELSPVRELVEELRDEHSVVGLECLQNDTQCTYLHTCKSQFETSRKGLEGVRTQYYQEVFDVKLPKHAEQAILQHTKDKDSRLRLLTDTELSAQSSQDGLPVADTVYSLFAAN